MKKTFLQKNIDGLLDITDTMTKKTTEETKEIEEERLQLGYQIYKLARDLEKITSKLYPCPHYYDCLTKEEKWDYHRQLYEAYDLIICGHLEDLFTDNELRVFAERYYNEEKKKRDEDNEIYGQ